MKEIREFSLRTFAIRLIYIILIALMLVVLTSLTIDLFPARSAGLDSEQDDLQQKNQELERRLQEEEMAHSLTKAKYQILQERFSQLLFDGPREIEFKSYYVRLLEEEFRVRLFEEQIPWDTHETYLILRIFRNFPKEVKEYFLAGASPVLTIKIENLDRMVTQGGTTALGLYYPCLHTITLDRSMLRGSWFNFPSELRVRKNIIHELAHAYDRARALAELKGAFTCTLPAMSYYSAGNEEYRKIIESGGNVHEGRTFDTQEELVIENFGEVFEQYVTYRDRKKLPSSQYDFFYQNVFCGQYLIVLKELEKENEQLLREKPSLVYELRDAALELTESRHFCS